MKADERRGDGIELSDPVDVRTRHAGEAAEVCPSCDTPGSWSPSKRHRFNPFGGVLAMVLAFWALLFGMLIGLGPWPALALALTGVVIIAWRRTALVCQVCGFVRPRA